MVEPLLRAVLWDTISDVSTWAIVSFQNFPSAANCFSTSTGIAHLQPRPEPGQAPRDVLAHRRHGDVEQLGDFRLRPSERVHQYDCRALLLRQLGQRRQQPWVDLRSVLYRAYMQHAGTGRAA